MSPKIPTTLPELRQYRGLLDQVITGMEILSGERDMPPLQTTMVTVVETPERRALPPVKRKYTRRKKRAQKTTSTAAQPAAKQTKPVAPVAAAPDGQEAERALKALKSLGGTARKEKIMQAAGLNEKAADRARNQLVVRGEIVVRGWARGARWSLPGAKEAP